MARRIPWLLVVFAAAGCGLNELGLRRDPAPYPSEGVAQIGAAAFHRARLATPVAEDSALHRVAGCVVRALTARSTLPHGDSWEVEVFDVTTLGAFALPGGGVGVHAGLVGVAGDADRLAAIVAHQVAHVTAGHTIPRVSEAYVTRSTDQLVKAIGHSTGSSRRHLLGVLGASPPVGDIVPFSVEQEGEADRVGQELMADAGFDPARGPSAWNRLAEAEASAVRGFLAVHPTVESHRSTLETGLSAATARFRAARSAGRRPRCG